MRRAVLAIVGLIFLAGVVAADTIDLGPSTITSSTAGWLVANGVDHATINVTVKSSSGPVTGAQVNFSVSDPALGTITPTTPVITGTDGIATATFTTSHKSGTAVISADIKVTSGEGISTWTCSLSQRIDHNELANTVFTKTDQVPIGSVTPLIITFTDGWGNRIDNKNPAESHIVTLQMNGDGGSGVWDGSAYATSVSLPADAEGNVSVNVRVSTTTGNNPITLVETVGGKTNYIPTYIEGIATTPSYLSQTVTPVSPSTCSSLTSCPADGEHPFNLYYTVLDQYHNPVKGTVVWINTTQGGAVLGTPYSTTTDSSGVAFALFNQEVMGTYTLIARSAGNSSIVCTDPSSTGYCSQDVEYYATDPVDMQFIISPEVVVSRDVNASSQANLMARVMDAKGNAVKTYHGIPMNVSFVINGPDTFPDAPSASPYVETTVSSLSAAKANMGDDGFATVQFYPGAFAKSGQTGYNATATGQVTVTASWTDLKGNVVNRTGTVVWKNYPYLSLTSSALPPNPKVGENLTVTIRIVGDGAALHPKPIDVVLVMDRSGSMGYDSPTRISSAQDAAKTFVSKMDSSKDRIGVVSFAGYTTGTETRPDVTLTYDYSTVDDKINTLSPNGATETRDGLKQAIDMFVAHPNPNSNTVSAIILMTDGDYNWLGNPLGRGTGYSSEYTAYYYPYHNDYPYNLPYWTNNLEPNKYQYYDGLGDGLLGTIHYPDHHSFYYTYPDGQATNQNMAVYAKNHNVRLYMIAFAASESALGSQAKEDMKTLASSTGGFYEYAPDGDALTAIYTKIAGELNEQAGGSTVVAMNFGTIKVVNVSENADIGDYLDYRYSDPVSTNIYMFNKTADYYRYTRSDIPNWTPTKKELSFDVGTIKLNDTWQTTMMFNLTQNGTLVLFGPDHCSSVSFTDASTGKTTSGCIPSLMVDVRSGSGMTGLDSNILLVDPINVITGVSSDPNIIQLQWNTTYAGPTASSGSVGETIEYCNADASSCTASTDWNLYSVLPSKGGPIASPGMQDAKEIDTSGWAYGNYYLRVYAVADNAPDSHPWVSYPKNPPGGSYIKLE